MASKKTSLDSLDLQLGHITSSFSNSFSGSHRLEQNFIVFNHFLSHRDKFYKTKLVITEIKCNQCYKNIKIRTFVSPKYILEAKDENRDILNQINMNHALKPVAFTAMASVLISLMALSGIFGENISLSIPLLILIVPLIAAYIIAFIDGKLAIRKSLKKKELLLISVYHGNKHKERIGTDPINAFTHVQFVDNDFEHGMVVPGTSGNVVVTSDSYYSSSAEVLSRGHVFNLNECKEIRNYNLYFAEHLRDIDLTYI